MAWAGSPCARCELLLRNQPPGAGRLFLWPPLGHTAKKMRAVLRGSKWSLGLLEDECLVAAVGVGGPGELCQLLAGALTSTELHDTRVLFVEGDAAPSIRDMSRVDGLDRLLAGSQSSWLVQMLADDRLTALFQPIVHADAPDRIFAQECLLRGVDVAGALVPPLKLLDAGREVDVLFQLDLAARRTAIREASRHGIRSKIFINFTPTSIYDPVFCLRSTVAAIDHAGIAHEDVVFEVIETDRAHDPEHLKAILAYYRNEGFGVALDDMGAGYSSLNLIHQLRPDYIKLDMELTRGVHEDPYKALIASKMLEIASELGISSIAEGVEHPEEYRWLRGHGATYAQGYLFGRPSSPPLTEISPPLPDGRPHRG